MDIVILMISIFFPLIGVIVGLFLKREEDRSGRPSSQMAKVSLVIASVLLALEIIAGIVAGIIAFTFFSLIPDTSSSAPHPVATSTVAELEITQAEVAAAKNVIVLRAVGSDGSSLSGADLAAARAVIEQRIDRAHLDISKVAFGQDRIYVIFFDDANPEVVASAADLVTGDLRLELRPVLTVGECTQRPVVVVEDADGGIVACSRDTMDAYGGYTLGPVAVSGDRIKDAVAIAGEPQSSTGEWFVSITFDAQGAQSFADLTTKLMGATAPNDQLAMVLDGEVLSAPRVLAVITDGKVQISGSFAQDTAESLAAELRLASKGVTFTLEDVKAHE